MARLIDADALLAKSFKYRIGGFTTKDVVAANNIKTAPTIDAEPVRHGHWIMKKTAADAPYTVCSHCNTSVRYNDEYGMVVMNLKGANYCPNCGAKIDGVNE